ncbi:MAG TPA: SDR family oxidoreductase [Spirochaetales bacterium]|nr:SDR family oxidoreductase [Spirochaetales bacterium]
METPQDRGRGQAAGRRRKDRPSPLAGRRALVVGGSGGIGAALAAALAARGADLLIHGGSSRERLAAAVARAEEAGRGALGDEASGRAPAGASARPSVESLLLPLERPSDLVDRLPGLGRVDILAVAFGPFVRKALHETGAADWERLALLDLALPGALASALIPAMAARGYGRILFFGGTRTDAIRAYSSNAAYAAAKTGLAVLAKSIAAEYSQAGIGAFVLCPGFVDTEYLGEGQRAELRSKAPGGRLIEAEEIAEFAASLVAAEPCIASGAVVALDGGLKL